MGGERGNGANSERGRARFRNLWKPHSRVPSAVATRLCIPLANGIAASLFRFPMAVTAAAHLALLYAILHVWAEISDYRVLVLRLTLIAVMLTLSLNVINGYMGE